MMRFEQMPRLPAHLLHGATLQDGSRLWTVAAFQKMAAQIEYEADTWERDNAFVQAMWAQLGGTPAQLDDLFTLAVTL